MTVLNIDDVYAYLRMQASAEPQLPFILAAAEELIASRVGPLTPTQFVETIHTDGVLRLRHRPLRQIVAATDQYGTTVAPDLTFDASTGVVDPAPGARWRGRYTFTYVAGYEKVPGDLRLAILELTRHLWQTQRGPTASRSNTTTSAPSPGQAHALPYRVAELIADYQIQMVA